MIGGPESYHIPCADFAPRVRALGAKPVAAGVRGDLAGRRFGGGKLSVLFRVYLPQLYPYLMAAVRSGLLRSGLALVWKIVLVVELLGHSNGVGFQLNIFFRFLDIGSILFRTCAFAAVILAVEAAG